MGSMGENGVEYEPDGGLEVQESLQALVYGILILASMVWLIVGFQDSNPVVLSAWLCIGGFATFMLARLWFDGAPIADS